MTHGHTARGLASNRAWRQDIFQPLIRIWKLVLGSELARWKRAICSHNLLPVGAVLLYWLPVAAAMTFWPSAVVNHRLKEIPVDSFHWRSVTVAPSCRCFNVETNHR